MSSWATVLSGGTPVVGGPLALTYITNATDGTDTSTYSFASQSIGAEADRDYVLVCVVSRLSGSTTAAISSVTVGGVGATSRAGGRVTTGGADTIVSAIYSAVVPTGTTATVDVVFSASMARCAIAVYTLKNNSSITPTATNIQAASSSFALGANTATPSGNSVLLASGMASVAADTSCSWTGPTKDTEVFWDTSGNASWASKAYSSAATQTVTFNVTNSSTQCVAVAVFQ